MRPRIFAIAGSPRRQGNTEILLNHAIEGAEQTGAKVEKLVVADMDIVPCTSCGVCLQTGQCPIEDQMGEIYHQLTTCHGLIISTPVFFYGVPAQLKALVDRCQALWAAKERLGLKVRGPGSALLISVGGTGGEKVFQGVRLTMGLVFKLLGMEELKPVLVPRVDEKGEILKQPETLELAREMGRKLVERILLQNR